MWSLIWLGLGVNRLAFGGGIASGLRTPATILAALIAFGASWGHPWPVIAVNIAGLLLLMTLPHGPMLTLPISQRSDGKIDQEYRLIAWIKNDELRWWAYALLRYPGVASVWAVALWFIHAPFLGLLATISIPVTYRVLWPFRDKLPQFNRPGDQVENWTELCAWTVLGAALVVSA